MFWDKAAILYDLFENIYNGDVNRRLVSAVSEMIDPDDRVLECACGTGMISKGIASRCKELIATDFSTGMLKQARKSLSDYGNVKLRRADITQLKCKDETFDKVVAGNVIHLLDDSAGALNELVRVCKKDGLIIVPTYVNNEKAGKSGIFIKLLERFGADFKKQFDYSSYQKFFAELGYEHAQYKLIDGKMPCAIGVIKKH